MEGNSDNSYRGKPGVIEITALSCLFSSDIKAGNKSHPVGNLEYALKIVKTPHFPEGVRLLVAYIGTAIQCDALAGFKGKLMPSYR